MLSRSFIRSSPIILRPFHQLKKLNLTYTQIRAIKMSAIAEAPKASSSQPEWTRPTPQTKEPVLEVYNSMTRKKEVFTPVNGRRVDWYNCGPTVYDSSHMGHARYVLSRHGFNGLMTGITWLRISSGGYYRIISDTMSTLSLTLPISMIRYIHLVIKSWR